jgi:hypothetical protein
MRLAQNRGHHRANRHGPINVEDNKRGGRIKKVERHFGLSQENIHIAGIRLGRIHQGNARRSQIALLHIGLCLSPITCARLRATSLHPQQSANGRERRRRQKRENEPA